MTKVPIQSENKSQEATQRRHQNFDYTTIEDRFKIVNWSNYYHPTGVVKPVYGIQIFQLTKNLSNQKDTHLKIC